MAGGRSARSFISYRSGYHFATHLACRNLVPAFARTVRRFPVRDWPLGAQGMARGARLSRSGTDPTHRVALGSGALDSSRCEGTPAADSDPKWQVCEAGRATRPPSHQRPDTLVTSIRRKFRKEVPVPKLIIFLKHSIDDLLSPKRRVEERVSAFQEEMTAAVGALADDVPGVRRCSVSSTLQSGYRSRSPLYDVVAEMWFDDESGALAARDADAYRTLAEHRLMESSRFCSILAQDHVAKDGAIPPAGVKSFEMVTRKPGMELDQFQSYWKQVHGPLAARIPMIRRYVQSHCLRREYDGGNEPAWDGVAITWFDDTDSMRRSAETRELAETRDDEPNFLAPGHLPFIITTETFLVGGRSDR